MDRLCESEVCLCKVLLLAGEASVHQVVYFSVLHDLARVCDMVDLFVTQLTCL